MIKRMVMIIFFGLLIYYIYDNNVGESKQFVRDITRVVYTPSNNQYTKTNITFSFAKQTTDFVPDNKQELIDIYYTVINSGWDNFIFYCNYDDCIDDANKIGQDINLLSNLNSFVSPFNEFSTISTYNTKLLNSKVNIVIERTYSSKEIDSINIKINEIYNSLSLDNDNVTTKIRKIHDYIINNTKYDSLKINNTQDTTYKSNTAYGLLFDNYAVCSGYADTMALFLDKMDIPNMKIASSTHIWNLVYIDSKWYHLDLTWDDPYSPDENKLTHNFFLVDYENLKKWETVEHNFDESIYIEALN